MTTISTLRKLILADCLDALKKIPDNSVNLVLSDPPWGTGQTFGAPCDATKLGFVDKLSWGQEAERSFDRHTAAGGPLADFLRYLWQREKRGPKLAYWVWLAERLVECHRVLSPNGVIAVHYDTRSAPILHLLLAATFGADHHINTLVWKRTHSHGNARKFPPTHDLLLVFGKSKRHTWNQQFTPYDQEYVAKNFTRQDESGLYNAVPLAGPGACGGSSGKPWRGIPPPENYHWAPPDVPPPGVTREAWEAMISQERLDALDAADRIHWPKKVGGMPRYKLYDDEARGVPVSDVIVDIPPVSSNSPERMGPFVQKPQALNERIITAFTNPGEIVLDPFAGCASTLAAAEALGRDWIGLAGC